MKGIPEAPKSSLPPGPGPGLQPSIVWGGYEETLGRFPEDWELRLRCGDGDERVAATPLDPFIRSVAAAQERVWILDVHFDDVGVEALVSGLAESPNPSRLEVRILGSDMNQNDARERAKIVTDWFSSGTAPRVEWYELPRGRVYPHAHDRFSIVDAELFHFGGTVGGAMRRLTAATCGWDAASHKADRFFAVLWREFSL